MERSNLFNCKFTRTATCTCDNQFQRVVPGMAITPAQMLEMASKGIPVSVSNAAAFSDGDTNPSWSIPPERVRGIDAADLWQLQQSTRTKLRKMKKDAAASVDTQTSNS